MQMKSTTSPSAIKAQVIRFIIVGVLATGLQYGVYLALVSILPRFAPSLANTVAYAVSFVFNYIASTRFTFRVRSTAKRGAGFVLSHVVNYVLQTLLLALFLHLGIPKHFALIPVFAICVPTNFILVRFFPTGILH